MTGNDHWYDYCEEMLGMLCPALGVLAIAAHFGASAWAGILFIWIGCGLCTLHLRHSYPRLTVRPFTRGVFSAAAGALWPLWLYLQPATGPRRCGGR